MFFNIFGKCQKLIIEINIICLPIQSRDNNWWNIVFSHFYWEKPVEIQKWKINLKNYLIKFVVNSNSLIKNYKIQNKCTSQYAEERRNW